MFDVKMNVKCEPESAILTKEREHNYKRYANEGRSRWQSLTMRGVFGQLNASLIQNLVERRPAASAVVLRVRGEQFLIAHDAGVRSLLVELVVTTGKRPAPNKVYE